MPEIHATHIFCYYRDYDVIIHKIRKVKPRKPFIIAFNRRCCKPRKCNTSFVMPYTLTCMHQAATNFRLHYNFDVTVW